MNANATKSGRAVLLTRTGLILLAFMLAIVAGCGGQPSDQTGANTNTSTQPVPSTPTPDTSAPNAGANEPASVVGARVYAARCALCHGPEGRGDGPGAAALNPKPRNYHDKAYMSTRTDAELLEVIRNGKGAMPRWSGILSEAEMSAVLQHVRGLGANP